MSFQWKDIHSKQEGHNFMNSTSRAKVEGGWMLLNICYFKNQLSSCMQFVSDLDHEWELEEND